VPDLDDAELRCYAQIRRDPEWPLTGKRYEREVQRIGRGSGPVEHVAKVLGTLIRPVGEVRPNRWIANWRMRGRIQELGVGRGLEGSKQHV
jgi:hypothetical protein